MRIWWWSHEHSKVGLNDDDNEETVYQIVQADEVITSQRSGVVLPQPRSSQSSDPNIENKDPEQDRRSSVTDGIQHFENLSSNAAAAAATSNLSSETLTVVKKEGKKDVSSSYAELAAAQRQMDREMKEEADRIGRESFLQQQVNGLQRQMTSLVDTIQSGGIQTVKPIKKTKAQHDAYFVSPEKDKLKALDEAERLLKEERKKLVLHNG